MDAFCVRSGRGRSEASVVVFDGVILRLDVVVRERRSRARQAGSDDEIYEKRSLVVVSDGTEKHNVECCE